MGAAPARPAPVRRSATLSGGPLGRGPGQRIHLLLSSGGVRCLSYVGALGELEARGFEIATVSTCSAGTFVGALYCSGLRGPVLREAALTLDLRRLAGGGRWQSVRRLPRLRTWPYALNDRSGFATAFTELLQDHGRPGNPTLGQLQPPLSTAAVDVAARRMLVYSTRANPAMPVTELLRIAVALPLLYPPHERHGRALLDAALATHSPVWLATGQDEDLPIVVLRAPALTDRHLPHDVVAPDPADLRRRRNVVAWLAEVVDSSVTSRDTIQLERLPRVRVIDIETCVPGLRFHLSPPEAERVVDAGRHAVAQWAEREAEPPALRLPTGDQDDEAEREAEDLYRHHLDRVVHHRTPTVFLSYAREDRPWVERLRHHLRELVADPEVSVWDDSYIRPGAAWAPAVEDAIRHARVAVLLVSRHFCASDFITRTEVPLLREQSARRPLPVVWVSVDGALPDEPEQALQAVGSAERPLASLDEPSADEVLARLARVVAEEYRRTASTDGQPGRLGSDVSVP